MVERTMEVVSSSVHATIGDVDDLRMHHVICQIRSGDGTKSLHFPNSSPPLLPPSLSPPHVVALSSLPGSGLFPARSQLKGFTRTTRLDNRLMLRLQPTRSS